MTRAATLVRLAMCVCSNRPTTRMWTAARQCVSRVVCCARLRLL